MAQTASPVLYGVLGFPVKHSLSPAMHNAALRALGIKAEYRLFEIPPEQLNSFFSSLAKNNISGINVTIPYKEKALVFVSLTEDHRFLKEVGAINTVIARGEKLGGMNTDIPGFLRHLREYIDPEGKQAAIIGAGGAARAVTYALASSGAAGITLFDCDLQKSRDVAEMVRRIFPGYAITPVNDIAALEIRRKDILINATPVGMKASDPCLVLAEMLSERVFVYDLIYNPAETKLLALAKKQGCRCANGLRMLLYQGMLSFEYWIGRPAPEEIMFAALQEGVRKL